MQIKLNYAELLLVSKSSLRVARQRLLNYLHNDSVFFHRQILPSLIDICSIHGRATVMNPNSIHRPASSTAFQAILRERIGELTNWWIDEACPDVRILAGYLLGFIFVYGLRVIYIRVRFWQPSSTYQHGWPNKIPNIAEGHILERGSLEPCPPCPAQHIMSVEFRQTEICRHWTNMTLIVATWRLCYVGRSSELLRKRLHELYLFITGYSVYLHALPSIHGCRIHGLKSAIGSKYGMYGATHEIQ